MEDREDRLLTLVQGTNACGILVKLKRKCQEARLGVSDRKNGSVKGGGRTRYF